MKKLLTYLCILFIFLSFYRCSEDQIEANFKGEITGTILDAKTNSALEKVLIQTEPASNQTILTDIEGKFTLSAVDTGQYTIIAKKNEYVTTNVKVRVDKDETSIVTILLEEEEEATGTPPIITNNFSPTKDSKDNPLDLKLLWQATDKDKKDSVKFEVVFYEANTSKEIYKFENYYDTSVQVNNLNYETSYFWQVIATDTKENTVKSEIRSFSTKPVPSNSIYYSAIVDGNYEIMNFAPEDQQVAQITSNGHRDWSPKVNEKINKVAYVSYNDLKPYLYTMDMNGDNVQKITEIALEGNHNYGEAFDWNFSSGKIVYGSYRTLYQIDAIGTNNTKIVDCPEELHFSKVSISNQGNSILALAVDDTIYKSKIYQMDIDGSNLKVVVGDSAGIVSSPVFALDGNSFLYTLDKTGYEDLGGRQLDSRIYSFNPGTNEWKDLSVNKPNGTNDLNPSFDPTGAKIIFMNVPNDNSKDPEVWTMDLEGNNRTLLFKNGYLPNWG